MVKPLSHHLDCKMRIPILDGLRFCAALFVMMAHYTAGVVGDQGISNTVTVILGTLSGIGMPLFFVLSGFVIHYNYHRICTEPHGLKNFAIARFTRLYPLYIALFIIEFSITFHQHNGSCGQAGERWGLLLAVPYYLTLTQDWVFGVIGQNTLIYQYGMMSAIAWSISLEVFFYLCYPLLARLLIKCKGIIPQITLIGFAQVAVVAYLLICLRSYKTIEHVAQIGFGQIATVQHGYQDSLLRWLYYFNPLVNLPAFFIGTLVANIYLLQRDTPLSKIEQAWGGLFASVSCLVVLAAHFWLYGYLARYYRFIGSTASVLVVPCIALMIYCLVRYPSSLPSRLLSKTIVVKLGEASYSIYLLHAFFFWYPRKFYDFGLNPWVLYVLAMGCVLLISRLSYVVYERPVQRWMRKKMISQDTVVSTTPLSNRSLDPEKTQPVASI